MARINQPQRPGSGLGELLTVGGAVVGGIYGGPGGAVTGAGLGQTAGGLIDPAKPPAPSAGGSGSEAAAMARRSSQMGQDTLGTLKNAEASLPQLPEAMRQQYAPAIIQARMLEEQKRKGMA